MDKSIVLTTQMRVGSTWLHDLLGVIFKNHFTGFVQAKELTKEALDRPKHLIKTHHVSQDKLFKICKPEKYMVLSLVRNPRDRQLSLANLNKKLTSETLYKKKFRKGLKIRCYRQLAYMELGYSTRSPLKNRSKPYCWTTYEWLIENPELELRKILQFLNLNPNKPIWKNRIERALALHPKTTNIPEKWVNNSYFTEQRLEASQEMYNWYKERIKNELNNNIGT